MPIQPINTAVSVWTASRVPKIDTETAPPFAHEGQLKLWAAEGLDIVALAGVQGGKTLMNPYWLMREIQRTAWVAEREKWPAAAYIYAGPSLTLLGVQAMRQFEQVFEQMHKLGKLKESGRPVFEFSEEGAYRLARVKVPILVHFAYLSDPDTIVSVTALAAIADEHGQSKNKQGSYQNLLDRLSVARSLGAKEGFVAGRVLHTTTPYEMNWFYTDVVLPAEKDGRLINWPTWANPSQDKQTIMGRKSGMEMWRWSMQYEGKFTKPAGQIYDCFDANRHVVPDFPVPAHWKVYSGHDFGEVNMAAVFVAVKPAGEVLTLTDDFGNQTFKSPEHECGFVYDSYHYGGRHVLDHAQKMKQRAGRPLARSWGGAKSEDVWRGEFARAGLRIGRPRVPGVEEGIARVYRQIKTDGLFFFKAAAQKVYDEVFKYSREIDDEGQPTAKIQDKEKWHRADSLRYLCSSLWPEPVAEPKPRPYRLPEVRQI